jgi:hypothetical protein
MCLTRLWSTDGESVHDQDTYHELRDSGNEIQSNDRLNQIKSLREVILKL